MYTVKKNNEYSYVLSTHNSGIWHIGTLSLWVLNCVGKLVMFSISIFALDILFVKCGLMHANFPNYVRVQLDCAATKCKI